MTIETPLVLASQSPRRRELMERMGWEFETVSRDVEEIIPDHIHPRAVAVLISENKAKAYGDLAGKNIVITADTIVVLENQILAKPEDEVEAIEMLRSLSGRTHSVFTGVTLYHQGKFRSFSEQTEVTFRDLTAKEISWYVEKYEPYDKAGGYGIQEWIGMIGVTKIEGDYYNVVGLPVGRLYRELNQFA